MADASIEAPTANPAATDDAALLATPFVPVSYTHLTLPTM